MDRITWPAVVLVAMGLGAFVGIFALIPDDEPASRTALLGVITVGVGAVTTWVTTKAAREIKGQVQQLQQSVDDQN